MRNKARLDGPYFRSMEYNDKLKCLGDVPSRLEIWHYPSKNLLGAGLISVRI